MTTSLTYLALIAVLVSPFALALGLSWAARRTGILRLSLDQFRPAAPFLGRLVSSDNSLDRDGLRAAHDLDAIRTRFEAQPSWPASSASGERR
jgi:hypothetical protein